MNIIKYVMVLLAVTMNLYAAPDKMESKLALGGYCPVCYIAADKANMGDAKFTSELKGMRYQFVSAKTKAMFDADPTKFLPEYDGYCAYGMSLGKKFESDPTTYTVVDGKIYLNKNAEVKELFAKGTEGLIVKADKEWASMEKKKMEMKK
ncbi:MAG: YHS domain-containing (seleno)protein [Akkermansiaceae bacterium]